MKSFVEYTSEWFQNFVENAHPVVLDQLMEVFGYTEEQVKEAETIPSDYILLETDMDTVFEKLFGFDRTEDIDDIPSPNDFILGMLKQAVGGVFVDKYDTPLSFVGEFLEDMASHIEGYSNPLSFFKDLQHGCVSGMIGILIYNNDCKKIYIDNIDDMEGVKSEMEGEMGSPIQNGNAIPHYTFMCWLCYEELGFSIACDLFPDEF